HHLNNQVPPPYHYPLFSRTSHPTHRDLPSFPTRRSSDLEDSCGSPPPAPGDPLPAQPVRRKTIVVIKRIDGCTRIGRYIARRPRSEEHTSELQSLRHLVCRLLLEKKKKISTTQMIYQYYF